MSENLVSESKSWGLSWEKYFYYFMGLRKGELKKDIAIMKEQYPDDDADQLARRVVNAQVPLSVLGGAVLHVPMLIPGVSPVLKFLGIATGTSVMVILNMTMLLQIALVYGHNIDDRARLKEMLAIITASGVAGSSSLLPVFSTLSLNYRVLAGATTVTTVSQLIGEAAIRYYRGAVVEDSNLAPAMSGEVSG